MDGDIVINVYKFYYYIIINMGYKKIKKLNSINNI